MKIKRFIIGTFLMIAAVSVLLTSCEPEPEPTPTNELMQGVWKVEAVYDENDSLITDKVTSFFPAFVHMDDKNSVNSTCGPLFMYIVYGKSKFINIISKLDEVFSYADLSLTEGEWFIDKNEVVDKYTIEMKLKFPGFDTFTEILGYMGIDVGGIVGDMLDAVVYHKFRDVKVTISDENPNLMIWEFTPETVALYNCKDQYGDYFAFTGVSVGEFSKCRVELTKQVKTLNQLVTESAESQN